MFLLTETAQLFTSDKSVFTKFETVPLHRAFTTSITVRTPGGRSADRLGVFCPTLAYSVFMFPDFRGRCSRPADRQALWGRPPAAESCRRTFGC